MGVSPTSTRPCGRAPTSAVLGPPNPPSPPGVLLLLAGGESAKDAPSRSTSGELLRLLRVHSSPASSSSVPSLVCLVFVRRRGFVGVAYASTSASMSRLSTRASRDCDGPCDCACAEAAKSAGSRAWVPDDWGWLCEIVRGLTGVAATRTVPRAPFSATLAFACACELWLCVRDRDDVGPVMDVERASSALLLARALLLNTVVMLTSRTIARLRSPPGPMLTERDRSRCSCSNDMDRERERARCVASSFVFEVPALAETDAVEVDDLSRFVAGLKESGGDRSSVSVSVSASSWNSLERKRAQNPGSFSLNLGQEGNSQLSAPGMRGGCGDVQRFDDVLAEGLHPVPVILLLAVRRGLGWVRVAEPERAVHGAHELPHRELVHVGLEALLERLGRRWWRLRLLARTTLAFL